jgi:hypothetical protein
MPLSSRQDDLDYMLTLHGRPCHARMVLHAKDTWKDPALRSRVSERGLGMLRTITGGGRLQPTDARRRFPARRLHLVDIENLAGSPRPDLSQVRLALGLSL